MRGVELSPASAIVRPYAEAAFHTYAASGSLAGLLVGSRATSHDEWQPAIARVTVTHVIVQGISLHIAPWQDLIADGDLGWPLFGSVSSPQSFTVFVRNDEPTLRELRVVLVMHGDDVDEGRGVRRRSRLVASRG